MLIPQTFGAPVTHRLRNRTILGGQSNIYVHHIHAEGACFVWVVEDVQHAAVREWAFLTEFERQLVDSFVSSLRSQAHII